MNAKHLARRSASVAGATLVTGLLVVGPALPAHAAECKTVTEGYSHKVIKVCGEKVTRGDTTTTTVSNSGDGGVQLPLTGADVTLYGTGALVLIGGGSMLLVAGRKRRAAGF